MLKWILRTLTLFFVTISVNAGVPLSYASAVKIASPAVVNLYIIRQAKSYQRERPNIDSHTSINLRPLLKHRIVLGSGVVLDKRGYVVTNYHVVRDRKQILISLTDGRSASAKLIGSDPETDLAVLKIDLEDIPIAPMGNSDDLQVGDIVLAIGNPFGLGQTVTQGIISAIGRTAVGLSNIENFIQTDVALNPGSSGGALINTNGQLIGINAGIYSRSGGYQGVSFAIPIKAVENVLKQIIEQGKVIRGWLGVEVVNLDPLLKYDLKSKQSMGVVVEEVQHQSPAFNKLKSNDIITEMNQRKVRDAQSFISQISQQSPGKSITLTVYRDNKPQQLEITLGSRPQEADLWQEVMINGKKYQYPDSRF